MCPMQSMTHTKYFSTSHGYKSWNMQSWLLFHSLARVPYAMIDRNGLRLKPIDPPGTYVGSRAWPRVVSSAKKRAFRIADLEGARVAIKVLFSLQKTSSSSRRWRWSWTGAIPRLRIRARCASLEHLRFAVAAAASIDLHMATDRYSAHQHLGGHQMWHYA